MFSVTNFFALKLFSIPYDWKTFGFMELFIQISAIPLANPPILEFSSTTNIFELSLHNLFIAILSKGLSV